MNLVSTNKHWTILTKSNCSHCIKAKNLLRNEILVTIVNCDSFLTNEFDKSKFLQHIKNNIGYLYNTFPMIFLNDNFIGGCSDLEKFLDVKMDIDVDF